MVLKFLLAQVIHSLGSRDDIVPVIAQESVSSEVMEQEQHLGTVTGTCMYMYILYNICVTDVCTWNKKIL